MIKKYFPILAISILLASIAVTGFQWYRVISTPVKVRRLIPLKPAATVTVPDEKTLREMSNLQNTMGRLLQPLAARKEPVNLKLFGWKPVIPGKIRAGARGTVSLHGNGHILTMAFKGKSKGFCVIDGTFYAQGARLPDGSIIRRVERNRVLLIKRKRKVWVDMVKDAAIQEQKAGKLGLHPKGGESERNADKTGEKK